MVGYKLAGSGLTCFTSFTKISLRIFNKTDPSQVARAETPTEQERRCVTPTFLGKGTRRPKRYDSCPALDWEQALVSPKEYNPQSCCGGRDRAFNLCVFGSVESSRGAGVFHAVPGARLPPKTWRSLPFRQHMVLSY